MKLNPLTRSSDNTEIKVLSYNLNLLPFLSASMAAGPGHGHASERLKEFLTHINDYDVILLQEVFSTPRLPMLCIQKTLINCARKLGFKYVRGRQPTLMDLFLYKKWTDSGLLILSKYRITDSDNITFRESTHYLDAGAAKGVLWAKVKIGSTFLHVFNCHLQASHTRKSNYDEVRKKQLNELRRLIVQKTHDNCAWILGGDFNIDAIKTADKFILEEAEMQNEESDDYKMLLNIIDPSKRVKDVIKLSYGYHPSTRPPREVINSILGIFRHKPVQRLDYLFYMDPADGILQPLISTARVNTFQVANKPFAYLSDHYALQLNIKYAEPGLKKSYDGGGVIDEIISWNSFNDYLMAPILVFLFLFLVSFILWTFNSSKLLALFWISFLWVYIMWMLFDRIEELQRISYSRKLKSDNVRSLLEKENNSNVGKDTVHHPVLSNSPDSNQPLYEDTIFSNFCNYCLGKSANKNCLGYRPKREGFLGSYEWLTYDDVYRRIVNFGSGLSNLGLKPGCKVAILCENRPEWIICHYACCAYGFITVPVLRGGKENFLSEILRDARPKVLVVSGRVSIESLQAINQEPDRFGIEAVIHTDRPEFNEYDLVEKMKMKLIPFEFVEQSGILTNSTCQKHYPTPHDIVIWIYSKTTSGTTKCIPISNWNCISRARNLVSAHGINGITLNEDDVHLSSFPLSRPYEMMICHLYLSIGASIAFSHPDSRFFDDAGEVKPTTIYCVPNSFMKMCGTYKIALASWGRFHHFCFDLAFQFKKYIVSLEKKYIDQLFKRNIITIIRRLIDHLIFSRFSAHLGGRVRFLLVSSKGHLSETHKQFLSIIFCCPVGECHLRTETGIFSCSSTYSIGLYPLCDIKLVSYPKFDRDNWGEICIKGSSIAKQDNVQVANCELNRNSPPRFSHGWFHTREIGEWNSNGTLTVFGHIEEILEPVKDCFVFPRHLEVVYCDSDFVHQIIILAKKYYPLVAIVVPNYEVVFRWAKENHIDQSYNPEKIYNNSSVIEAICLDLKKIAIAKNLKPYEEIKTLRLEQNEVPEMLILQRNLLVKKYAKIIDNMYGTLHPSRPRLLSSIRKDYEEEEMVSYEWPSLRMFRPTTRVTLALCISLAIYHLLSFQIPV